MILSLLLNYLAFRKLDIAYDAWMKFKDERMKQINELLSYMKVFKMYTWEKKLVERVYEQRNLEMKELKIFQIGIAFVIFLISGTRGYLILGILITRVMLGQLLTPGNVFAGIATIGILQSCLTYIPGVLSYY